MKANDKNDTPRQLSVRLPGSFVRWWLADVASEAQQAQSLSRSSSARRCVNENQLPESSRKIASVP